MLLNGKHIEKMYAIGIGGIGMSALARYCLSKGVKVYGYDRTQTALTAQLEAEGMQIWYDVQVDRAPKDVDLVMYTPAIPADHAELKFYQSNGYTVVKRSEVLEWISRDSFNICVAGTHGKTTISTMTAHLLRDSGYGCNAFLGGISANYKTNFWSDDRACCVIEADEFDRSFLKLHPDIAIVSATDPDHLDIYGTAEAFSEAFLAFTRQVKPGGVLFTRKGLPEEAEFKADHHFTYHSHDESADLHATKIKVEDGVTCFSVVIKGKEYEGFRLSMGGLHNIENMLAAIGVAHQLGIDIDKIKAAVANFRGVHRRFTYVYQSEALVVVDDYAHHPTELHALIQAARQVFPDRTVSIVFQPHLYSRTRDQVAGFAQVLQEADEVLLLPIYPARELPMEGVNSELIAERMEHSNVRVLSKTDFLNWLPTLRKRDEPGVLLMAGAGDIDQLVQEVNNVFEQKVKQS